MVKVKNIMTKMIFEGEYINGEKTGKGKEYHNNHNRFFKGDYLKGKWNGNIKEYDIGGLLLYEGEYLNGERNREGK